MRVRGVILCGAVLVSACGGASAATSGTATSAPPSGPPCGPRSATTLAASAVARVYSSAGKVFGCSEHGAGSTELGQTQTCIGRPQVGPVKVSGELAAYGVRTCGVDTGQGSIVVRRLDNQRVLHDAAAVTGRLRPESYTQVASLVLKPNGSVAWIGTGNSIVSHGAGLTEVHAIGRAGSRLLDSGAAVGAQSLRLRGSRLSWRHGGRTRTATLH